MSNLIQNGDFSSGSGYWTNPAGDGLAFTLGLGWATGASNPSGALEWTYKMCQQFSSNDEVITAIITVWAAWEAYPDEVDGYNRFIVELEKPDTTVVTLVDTTKTGAAGFETGSGNILSASDIKTHMTQYGNYKLWLTLKTKSARTVGIPREYTQSQGWYDNISINVTVKKYKTVIDKIGSAESHFSGEGYSRTTTDIAQLSESQFLCVKKFAMENLGLLEDYYVAGAKNVSAKETFGVSDLYTKKPKLFREESFGLIEMHEIVSGLTRHEHEYFNIDESLALLAGIVTAEVTQLSEDYAYHKFKPVYLTREDLGFSETYSAKRIRGNLETSYTVGTPTQWSSTVPVITGWIKKKTEIGG